MIRTVALASVLALATTMACSNKKAAPPAAGSGAAVARAVAVDAAPPSKPAPAVDAAPARTAVSQEVRAAYKLHLAAGRKAAKAARWPEAIAELEAALVAIPGDDRALAVLSFAAMSAGERDKARAAGRQAGRVATDPTIKAAALYNLGRVEEPLDPHGAAGLYRQSLALRPNQIVEQRLAGLASAGPVTPEPLPCTTPLAETAICDCLNQTVVDVAADARRCALTTPGQPDFRYATYTTSDVGEERVMLLARAPAGWAVVAHLADIYNPGAFGISEEWTLDTATAADLGGHQLVKFVGKKGRSDSDMGIDEVEIEETTSLTVCVRGDGKAATTCPLQVVTAYSYLRDRLGVAGDDEIADVAEMRTKGLPIKTELSTTVELGADGVAHVRAERGRPDPAALGDFKLW